MDYTAKITKRESDAAMRRHKNSIKTPKAPALWRAELRALRDFAAFRRADLKELQNKVRERYFHAHLDWHGYPPAGPVTASLQLPGMWTAAALFLFVFEVLLGAYSGSYCWSLGAVGSAAMGIFIATGLFAVATPIVKLVAATSDAKREQDRRLLWIAISSSILWAAALCVVLLLARAATSNFPGMEVLFNCALVITTFVSPILASSLTHLRNLRIWGNEAVAELAEINAEEAKISLLLLGCDEAERRLPPEEDGGTAEALYGGPSAGRPGPALMRGPQLLAAITEASGARKLPVASVVSDAESAERP